MQTLVGSISLEWIIANHGCGLRGMCETEGEVGATQTPSIDHRVFHLPFTTPINAFKKPTTHTVSLYLPLNLH